MNKFWSFLLMKSLPADSLASMNFALFGFGDSSYKNYNVMGRMLYQRLQQLGAKSFLDRGLGDDQAEGGYNLALVKWKKAFFARLSELTHLPAEPNEVYSGLKFVPESVYKIRIDSGSQYHHSDLKKLSSMTMKALEYINKKKINHGSLIENVRATSADHFQDVREITFTNPNKDSFSPGDTTLIYPSNNHQTAAKMLEHCDLQGDELLSLEDSQGTTVLQIPANRLFEQILDFSSPPKFFFFKLLAFFTDQQIYKEKITEMGREL
jgi:sulfite reductase alpha subunit-like flavoprotein